MSSTPQGPSQVQVDQDPPPLSWVSQPVMTIDYARPQAADLDPNVVRGIGLLIWVAVLSGLCVAVCFLTMAAELHILANLLHFAIFAATLVLAIRSGVLLSPAGEAVGDPSRLSRLVMDGLAGVGLIILAAAPFGVALLDRASNDERVAFSAVLGVAFGLMAATTVRHLLFHRLLGRLCLHLMAPGLRRSFVALGWFKTIYEGIWLTCCTLPLLYVALQELASMNQAINSGAMVLLAFAALFGCFGYGAVWVWMIVNHVLLWKTTRRVQRGAW